MATKARTRRKIKRKWNKTIGILSFVVVMSTIIIISALHELSLQPSIPPVIKEPADEYFSFSESLALAEPLDPENVSIRVSQVGFKITAVGGNATNVLIYPLQGSVPQEDTVSFDKILQGESIGVGPIAYASKVVTEKEENGYPLLFRVTCDEAEGQVTVYTDFLPAPGS